MTSDPQESPSDLTESTAPKAVETTAPEPTTEKTPDAPTFGWNAYAERINGRFAMVGFMALLLLELFTRQNFFTWLGF
ncbi:MAG: chlorophyll a/b-binding protein [Leptolyngbyaceae cyanobacterium]